MFCEKCGNEIKGNEKVCSKCGAPVFAINGKNQSQKKKKPILIIVGVVLALILILIFIISLANSSSGSGSSSGSYNSNTYETADNNSNNYDYNPEEDPDPELSQYEGAVEIISDEGVYVKKDNLFWSANELDYGQNLSDRHYEMGNVGIMDSINIPELDRENGDKLVFYREISTNNIKAIPIKKVGYSIPCSVSGNSFTGRYNLKYKGTEGITDFAKINGIEINDTNDLKNALESLDMSLEYTEFLGDDYIFSEKETSLDFYGFSGTTSFNKTLEVNTPTVIIERYKEDSSNRDDSKTTELKAEPTDDGYFYIDTDSLTPGYYVIVLSSSFEDCYAVHIK
ncbi:MAG: zinc-ribbon domain-containing protein [Eubacterium sp.]